MRLFILRRLPSRAVTLAAASVLVFSVQELLPGSAAAVMLRGSATPEAVAALRVQLGLDRPPLARYTQWVGGLLRGDTARSISYSTATAELPVARLRATLAQAAKLARGARSAVLDVLREDLARLSAVHVSRSQALRTLAVIPFF